MKTKLNTRLFFFMVSILLLGFTLMSCSKSGVTLTPQQKVTAALTANNWTMQSVNVDNVDKTAFYSGLTIKFTDNAFTTTHGGAVWPASGTWSFNSADGTTIKRDDGIVVTVEVTSSTLKLTLTWTKTTLGGGKISSISGSNVFSFVK